MLELKKIKTGFIVLFAIGLTGCATDIMQGYIGRTPQDVMARYGSPDNVFDMSDGRRAYQWRQVSQSVSAGSEESRTRWVERRNGRRERLTTTQVSPPVHETKECFYTMYAHASSSGVWIFDSFEQPELGC